MLRAAFLVASALTTSFGIGRKLLNDTLDKRKQRAIDEAAEQAREEIRHNAQAYIKSNLGGFMQTVLIKAVMLMGTWLLFRFGLLPYPVFSGILVVMLAIFILRDMWMTWPTATLIFRELRKHGWRPRQALGEVIAARVFEEVYNKASDRESGLTENITLVITGRRKDELSTEIAKAVADIARTASWHDLRPFAFVAAGQLAALSALYSSFVFVLVQTAG